VHAQSFGGFTNNPSLVSSKIDLSAEEPVKNVWFQRIMLLSNESTFDS